MKAFPNNFHNTGFGKTMHIYGLSMENRKSYPCIMSESDKPEDKWKFFPWNICGLQFACILSNESNDHESGPIFSLN